MDKTILLLFITKCVFQSTGCLDCQLATNRSTTSKVLIEWNHFPDGVQAERYLITYGSFSPLFSNFVRSAQGSNIILYDLQQNVNYYFTIKSMRNGKILDHKSFTTGLLGETAIITNVSTTTASFNWREFGTRRHITTISLNFTSYTVSPVVNNYTWNQLKPGTLYNFSLELKQLHHSGLSLTQVFYIMIETASCPPGWVGSLYSCYWIRKDYKQWKDASHFCESAVNRAHLIDINTEEEHKLVSSLLRSLDDFSMLWTGLNDIKTETELQWTDASPYNLSSILWQTLPMNESDCYALQLNPLGPNYLFTGLFCFLPLPYICEYEVLALPKTVSLKLEDVNENEATIVWDDLDGLISTRSELFIWFQTITGERKEYSHSILLNTTKATIPGLHPGQQYYFALMMRDGTGVQSTITPILSVKTRPNPPKNITIGKVSSTALEVLWSPPDESKNASFHHYLVSYMGFGSKSQGTENVKGDKTSLMLGNLKPFHSYKVYVQTVAEGGSLSCAEGPLLASTAPSPPVRIYLGNTDVWENRIIVHWEPPLEGSDEYYVQIKLSNGNKEVKQRSVTNATVFQFDFLIPGVTYDIEVMAIKNGKRSIPKLITQTTKPNPIEIVASIDIQTHSTVLYVGMPKFGLFDGINILYGNENKRIPLKNINVNVTLENLTPGNEYNFAVYATSGNMWSKAYRVPVVKTCLAPPTNLREGIVTETSLELLWDRAEGHFYQYEVQCLNCEEQLMVQKVDQECAVFVHLIPGKLHNISLRTEKEGFQDSKAVKKLIRTMPSPVGYLNLNKTSHSVTVSWPQAVHVFDGYNLTLSNKMIHQVVRIPFTQSRTHSYVELLPGTIYFVSIETTSAKKKSHPTTINVTTIPESPVDLQFVEQDEYSVYLFWKPPRGGFDIFELSYHLTGMNENAHRTTLRGNSFRIKDLIPGVEYVFQIKTIKGIDDSEIVEKRLKTKPERPQQLEVSNILPTAFTLYWRAPIGHVDYYKVILLPDQGLVNVTDLGDGNFKADVTDATPGMQYTATVSSISSSFSKSVSRSFITRETRLIGHKIPLPVTGKNLDPASPDGLTVGPIGATAIMLAWSLPSRPNGRILSYRVEYKEVCPAQQANFIQVSTNADTPEFLLNNLKPGTAYKIRIAAENNAGIGAFSTFRKVVTAESAPGPVSSLTATVVNHTTANVTWFLPKRPNGKITYFSIIIKSVRSGRISKNISVNADTLFPNTLPQCEDDSSTGTTPATSVSSSPPTSNGFLTVISENPIEKQTSPEFASIMVGQLKPYTTYLCEVSAFTKEGEGQTASTLFRTPEWLPEEPPQNLIVSKITSRSFRINWDPPATVTGRFSYRVELNGLFGKILQNSTRGLMFFFMNLLPFTKYEVFVTAETMVGLGPKASAEITTSSEVPGEVFDFKATEVEAKSARLEWGKPRQPNGIIIQYQITVFLKESKISVQNIILTENNQNMNMGNSTEPKLPGMLVTVSTTLTSKTDAIFTDVDEGSAELMSDSSSFEPAVTLPTFSPDKELTPVNSDLPETTTVHEKSMTASVPDQLTSHAITYSKPSMPSTTHSMAATGFSESFTKSTTSSFLGPFESHPAINMTLKLRSVLHKRSLTAVVKAGGISLPSSASPFLPQWRLLANGLQNITAKSESRLQVIDPTSEQLSYVVKELVPHTDYIIRVSAFTNVGEGPPTYITLKTREYVPSSVQNITYENITSTSILILWDPPVIPNGIITHYTIYAVEEGTTEAFQEVVMSNNITLTGLKKFTDYKMRVTASTSAGESSVSEKDDIFVRTLEDEPETPPENLTFKNVTETSAYLSWSPPEKPNGIITYYEVTYTNYTDSFTMNSSETNIYLENLKIFSPYNVSIKAYTKYGHGNQTSPIVFLVTKHDVPDNAPQNITYIFLPPSDVEISFLPPSTPNGIIQFYTLYLGAQNSSDVLITNSTNLTVIVTGLKANERYSLKISASTSKGEGIQSQPVYILTGEGVPGSPPRSVTSKQLSSTTVLLSWKPPTEPNGVILYYTIYVWSTTTQLILNETETSVLLKNLDNDTEYYAFVTANTWLGDGGLKSNNITFRTPENSRIAEGIISYVNKSSTSVQVFWNLSSKANGYVQYYTVHYRNTSGVFTQNITDIDQTSVGENANVTILLINLAKFSHYETWMTASNMLGDEIQTSELISVYTDEDVPSTPPQDLMIANYTADSVLVRWKPSPMPNGIVQFYSFKIIDNTRESTYFMNTTALYHEASLTGFETLHEYQISVSAFTKVGNGDQFSNIVIFKINESVPDTIQNLQCNASSWHSVIIKWDPPLKSDTMITYYALIFENDVQNVADKDRVHTFSELQSNTSYQFSVMAVNSVGQGESKNCTVTTLSEAVPSAPKHLEIIGVQSTYVILRWTHPDIIPGYLRLFRIIIQLRSVLCMNWDTQGCIEAEQTQDHNIDNNNYTMEAIVHGLKKFRWYRFRVAASTNAGFGNYSTWIATKTAVGYPDSPPENITVTVKSSDTIEIAWEEPEIFTGPTSYLIDVTMVDNGDFNMTILRSEKQNTTCEISDLMPFTRYSIIIVAFTGREEDARIHGKASEPIIVRTLEALPQDAPQNFSLQKIPDEVTMVHVSFLPPYLPNGIIQKYQAIIYKEGEAFKRRVNNLKIVKSNQSLTSVIEGLKGGNTYIIRVRAVNGAGAGPQTLEQKITMDVKAPPKPSFKPAVALDKNGALQVTSTTMTIRMPTCYFTDEHGSIKKIQVIVTEIRAMNDGNISTWYDAYVRKPKPYFANEGFQNPPCSGTNTYRQNDIEETYTIGSEKSCQQNIDKICNGPLKHDKQYLFKFRATNFQKQFTDSDYSDPVKTLAEGLSGRTIEIILAVTLCVLSVVLLVIAAYVIARIRQKQKEGGTYSPRDAEIIDTKFKLDQMIAVTDLELKEEKLTRPISKKLFLQHVEDLCVNNNMKFQEEFSELPKLGQELTSSDADLPWNRTKNRFANIKPYNNNRVKLMLEAGVPGSDFINASYVAGYLCPNEFIATQGPLPGTVADFWRMIWETRTQSIVMLTHCFEKGRIKCHQYWPEDNKPVTVFGDIVITKLAEDVQADWTIRELKIEKYGDYMMVTHFNFTSWPEHGVPETCAPLIHYVKLVRANRANDNTPIVVHCSAGVGRTGVFIALDHLLQHMNHHDFVDIFGFVAELRSERMCMVQNLAQYMFLHQCALELLNNKGTSRALWFVNYAALQKMDSVDTMEGDVELEWEETTM